MEREDAGKIFLLVFVFLAAILSMALINADIAIVDITTSLKTQFNAIPTSVFWLAGVVMVVQIFLLSKVDLEQ